MTITYIPDADFHARVDRQIAAALEADASLDPLALDQRETEELLAAGTWPRSWSELMSDGDKTELIARIVSERRPRRS